ncbi:MAG TPA: hypothetical protein VIR98_00625 [Candidatus Paceibacterota bacterium]
MKSSTIGLFSALSFVMSVLPTFGQVTRKSPQLVNLSCRSRIATGTSRTVGFVIVAYPGAPLNSSKQLLIRGVGPGLAQFGITNAMSDPQLVLYEQGRETASNNDWGSTAAETAAFNQVGAFKLPQGSKDAVISINLPVATGSMRSFTVTLEDRSNQGGVGLIEVYDVQRDTTALEIVNLSLMGTSGNGEDALIVGLTLDGVGSQQVMIRAIGPELAQFGVNSFMTDPFLSLRYQSAPNQFVTISNDNWSKDAINTAARVGAFPLSSGSTSAVVMPTMSITSLTSATATIQAGQFGGTVLVEAYMVK